MENDFDFASVADGEGNVTANQIAEAVNMNAKSVRRRIRNMTPDRAGRGGRWVISAADAEVIANRILTTDGRRETVFRFGDE